MKTLTHKRILAIVISLMMLLSILPIAASAAPMFTLTYDANGGENEPKPVMQINPDTWIKLSATVPTRDGFTFLYWIAPSDDNYLPGEWIYIDDEDIILTAFWKPLQYLLEYDVNGGENGPDPAQILVNADTYMTLSITEPTRDGFDFLGWAVYPSSEMLAPGSPIFVDRDITLLAIWNDTAWQVGYYYTSVADYTEYATVLHLGYAPPKEDVSLYGYTVNGWYLDLDDSEPFDFENTPITCDIMLYAKWISAEDFEVAQFKIDHADILDKTPGDIVDFTYKEDVAAALSDYEGLSDGAKAKLTDEKALLDALQAKLDGLEAAQWLGWYGWLLSYSPDNPPPVSSGVLQGVLTVYEGMSDGAKTIVDNAVTAPGYEDKTAEELLNDIILYGYPEGENEAAQWLGWYGWLLDYWPENAVPAYSQPPVSAAILANVRDQFIALDPLAIDFINENKLPALSPYEDAGEQLDALRDLFKVVISPAAISPRLSFVPVAGETYVIGAAVNYTNRHILETALWDDIDIVFIREGQTTPVASSANLASPNTYNAIVRYEIDGTLIDEIAFKVRIDTAVPAALGDITVSGTKVTDTFTTVPFTYTSVENPSIGAADKSNKPITIRVAVGTGGAAETAKVGWQFTTTGDWHDDLEIIGGYAYLTVKDDVNEDDEQRYYGQFRFRAVSEGGAVGAVKGINVSYDNRDDLEWDNPDYILDGPPVVVPPVTSYSGNIPIRFINDGTSPDNPVRVAVLLNDVETHFPTSGYANPVNLNLNGEYKLLYAYDQWGNKYEFDEEIPTFTRISAIPTLSFDLTYKVGGASYVANTKTNKTVAIRVDITGWADWVRWTFVPNTTSSVTPVIITSPFATTASSWVKPSTDVKGQFILIEVGDDEEVFDGTFSFEAINSFGTRTSVSPRVNFNRTEPVWQNEDVLDSVTLTDPFTAYNVTGFDLEFDRRVYIDRDYWAWNADVTPTNTGKTALSTNADPSVSSFTSNGTYKLYYAEDEYGNPCPLNLDFVIDRRVPAIPNTVTATAGINPYASGASTNQPITIKIPVTAETGSIGKSYKVMWSFDGGSNWNYLDVGAGGYAELNIPEDMDEDPETEYMGEFLFKVVSAAGVESTAATIRKFSVNYNATPLPPEYWGDPTLTSTAGAITFPDTAFKTGTVTYGPFNVLVKVKYSFTNTSDVTTTPTTALGYNATFSANGTYTIISVEDAFGNVYDGVLPPTFVIEGRTPVITNNASITATLSTSEVYSIATYNVNTVPKTNQPVTLTVDLPSTGAKIAYVEWYYGTLSWSADDVEYEEEDGVLVSATFVVDGDINLNGLFYFRPVSIAGVTGVARQIAVNYRHTNPEWSNITTFALVDPYTAFSANKTVTFDRPVVINYAFTDLDGVLSDYLMSGVPSTNFVCNTNGTYKFNWVQDEYGNYYSNVPNPIIVSIDNRGSGASLAGLTYRSTTAPYGTLAANATNLGTLENPANHDLYVVLNPVVANRPENFHFEYSTDIAEPRTWNPVPVEIITIDSTDYFVHKLERNGGIGQTVSYRLVNEDSGAASTTLRTTTVYLGDPVAMFMEAINDKIDSIFESDDQEVRNDAARDLGFNFAMEDEIDDPSLFNDTYGKLMVNDDETITLDSTGCINGEDAVTEAYWLPPLRIDTLLDKNIPENGFRFEVDVKLTANIEQFEWYQSFSEGDCNTRRPEEFWTVIKNESSTFKAYEHGGGGPGVTLVPDAGWVTFTFDFEKVGDDLKYSVSVGGTLIQSSIVSNYDDCAPRAFCPMRLEVDNGDYSLTIRNIKVSAI